MRKLLLIAAILLAGCLSSDNLYPGGDKLTYTVTSYSWAGIPVRTWHQVIRYTTFRDGLQFTAGKKQYTIGTPYLIETELPIDGSRPIN